MPTQPSRRPHSGRRPSTGSGKPGHSFNRNRNTSSRTRSGGGSRFGNRRPSGGGGRGRGSAGGGRKQPSFDPSKFINTNPVALEEVIYVPKHTFDDFGLHPDIVATVLKQGITSPSPIQDQVIPLIMEGKDVIGLAETGTGKTAAFLLPLIQKTLSQKNQQTIILTPTRELALQAEAEFRKFGAGFKLFATSCVGGTSIQPQIRALKRTNHFIIGTPGRILDLIDRGNLRTDRISNVVLDEADRMLDMGFIHDMRKILSTVTDDRQTLFFSATMTEEAKRLVNDFMRSPVSVSVKKKDVTDSIKQDVVPFEHAHKFDTLLALLSKDDFKRVIIFGSMKHSVEKLSQELSRNGVKAESIHGNKSHGQRQRALAAFKSGNARVLVATDVAARGIHVDNITHVINYDLPNTFEDYVHRIGRTGRGSKRGEALTFVPKR
jgi:ATP-dependent RNA helicase RhlE